MKNKYFYPIYKLKIKSWIKYWLIKQTEFKGVLSDILEGISFYLTDSADSRFRKFIPIGRTTQESTTGKQLLEKLINTPKSNGVKYSTDRLSVEVDFANSSDEYFAICNVESPTTKAYTLTFKASGVKNGETPKYHVDGRTSSIKTLVNGLNVVNIPSGTTIANNRLLFDDQQKTLYPNTSTVIFTDFMLVEGTYTEETMPAYEPYTGRKPAPNPNYPFPIKNTGDNGSVNEKVSNSDGTQEQNISFPLAQGQKLMEGDYLSDDGIHSLWNEDTVNGTTSTFSDAKTNGAYYCNQKVSGNLTGQTITFDTSVTNAIVQYELAQEQVIPYTEEQKTAWEQIKKARTYKNITHISSSDETPALLKIQYWKEA